MAAAWHELHKLSRARADGEGRVNDLIKQVLRNAVGVGVVDRVDDLETTHDMTRHDTTQAISLQVASTPTTPTSSTPTRTHLEAALVDALNVASHH